MGCNCSSASVNNYSAAPYYQYNSELLKLSAPQECLITKELLLTYQKKLQCCKQTNNLELIGLNLYQYNIYMGYIQSALNYPDNYCYYSVKLNEFATNILPRIINNVPICTNKL